MSSTSRGAQRMEHDYYATNPEDILTFLRAWAEDDPPGNIRRVLDPCAGGNVAPVVWQYKKPTAKDSGIITVPVTPMAYPTALHQMFGNDLDITTSDIRADSPADLPYSIFDLRVVEPFDLVATNPPFAIALEVIRESLGMVRDGGYVALFLRLNFLGSAKRRPFLQACPPRWIYVHSERPSFLPNGETQSNICTLFGRRAGPGSIH